MAAGALSGEGCAMSVIRCDPGPCKLKRSPVGTYCEVCGMPYFPKELLDAFKKKKEEADGR